MTSYGKKNVIHEGKRTISDWLSIFRKKESLTLNGRKLRLGDKIYFISLEDGACGEVNYYPRITRKYNKKKYMLFLDKKERDNVAFILLNNMGCIEEIE